MTELEIVLRSAISDGTNVLHIQEQAHDLRTGLEYMAEQRLEAQGRFNLGRIVANDPRFVTAFLTIWDPESRLSDTERLGWHKFLSKGEHYEVRPYVQRG
jgi:hypothetical protein